MANRDTRSYGPPEFVTVPTGTKTTAIYVGDLCYWDEADNLAKSAADFPWQEDEARTQAAFARLYIGVSQDYSAPAGTDPIRVSKHCAGRLDIASTTLVVDDLVCPEKASGNALEPQKLQITTDPQAAIGACLSTGASQTSILADLKSRYLDHQETHVNVADPGASGTLTPPAKPGAFTCEFVSVGAEARALANPKHPGQEALLSFKTDGGDVTLTITNGYDEAGKTVIVMKDAGDWLKLVGIRSGSNNRWRIVSGTDRILPNIVTAADPGNAGALEVDQSAITPIVSAGAETRTLPNPEFPGQTHLAYLKTDGGDVTLTVTDGFDDDDNDAIVFNGVGQWALFEAVESGATLRWRLVASSQHFQNLGITAKTANYSLTESDFNRVFTTRGAGGAVTFTLPAVAAKYKGKWVRFVNVADQDMIVAGTATQVVTTNNAAATSVAASTTAKQIGAVIDAYCDGTSWLVYGAAGGDGIVYTVA